MRARGSLWIGFWLCGLAALLFLGSRSIRTLAAVSAEDFVYYYAGTRAYWSGENPYKREVYQNRLKPLLGGENRYPSKDHPWLYPPAMAAVFAPFALLPKNPLIAYRFWSVFLGLCALVLALLCARGRLGPPLVLAPAVFFACPGADNAFFTHRVLWLSLAAWLAGTAAVARGRELRGGAALALLGVQPQWWLVSAACLAAGRRWRALGVSAGLNALVYSVYFVGLRPFSELTGYVANIAAVGGETVFSGNQSLAAGIYRLWLFAAGEGWTGAVAADGRFTALWWGSLAAVGAILWFVWRSRLDWREKSLLTFAFLVWAQPYTHGSEVLWALPGFLTALGLAFPAEMEFSAAAVCALAGTVAVRYLLDFPGGGGFVATVYLAAAIVLLFIARRRGNVSLLSFV
jgi:hypothetical protein